jgi:ubiquinone/menaquinone biosynthesis C-methylase UbiE
MRYDRRRYGGVGGTLRAFFVARAVRRALRVGGFSRGVVLDVACGTGVAARAAAGSDVRWIGVDISEGMLGIARRRSKGLGHLWVRADLEHPPFRATAQIDAIVCLRFLAHLPVARWSAVLGILARMTPGPVIVGLPMRRSSKHWWRALKRFVGLRAKRRPVFGDETVLDTFSTAGLEPCGSLWQSPFTDTALVVARRTPDRAAAAARHARAGVLSDGPATGAPRSP